MLAAGILAFVGVQPRRRMTQSVALGIGLYLVVGTAWSVIQGVGVLRLPVEQAIRPELLIGGWRWPFDLVQVLGLVAPPTVA